MPPQWPLAQQYASQGTARKQLATDHQTGVHYVVAQSYEHTWIMDLQSTVRYKKD